MRIAYDDYSSFEKLLEKDDMIPVHRRNLRTSIEMYKTSNSLSPLFTRDMMTETCVLYNTRSTTKVEEDENGSSRCTKKGIYEIPGTKTLSYGLESIRYLGPKMWMLISDESKN